MTREELIDSTVSAHADKRWMDADSLRELLVYFAHDLLNRNVPVDMHEAADSYVGHSGDIDEGYGVFAIRRAFKAGAEWMANQGETIEAEVYGCGDELDPEIAVEPTTVQPGDKVIVQIRKK